MSMSRTLATVLAGYALFRLGGDWRQHQLERRAAQPLAKPRDEVRWEGEGGALHDGPQTQVTGDTTPDGNTRH